MIALARNISVVAVRPQPIQPGVVASSEAPIRAVPRRWLPPWGLLVGTRHQSSPKLANTTAVAAKAPGSRAAHSLMPNKRKLRATIQ